MNRNRTQPHFLLLTLIVSTCFLFPPESVAQVKNMRSSQNPGAKSYRANPTGDGALTEEMLENCILAKRDIDNKYSEINEIETQIDSMQSEIEELKNQLSETKDRIDRIEELEKQGLTTRDKFSSPKSNDSEELTRQYKELLDEYTALLSPYNQLQEIIDEYNEKVESLSGNIAESNELLEKYNELLEPFNLLQEKYRLECKDQPFYEDDYNRIVEKLGYGL